MKTSLAAIGVAVALSGCASNEQKPDIVIEPPFTCAELLNSETPTLSGADETVAILAARYSDGTFVPIRPLAEANGKPFSRNVTLQNFAVRAIWLTWCQPGRPQKDRTCVSKVVLPFTFTRSPRPATNLPETDAN